MFAAIRNFIDGVRIAASFPEFNTNAKREHLKKAEADFSIEALKTKLAKIDVEVVREAELAYGSSIDTHQFEQRRLEKITADAEEKLRYFERDYRLEINSVYAELRQLNETKSECKAGISVAHEELKHAKSELADWYSRAEGNWIGNGGRELPKHAFFGQDLSDRDSLKEQKYQASQDLTSLHGQLTEIDTEIARVFENINEIKSDRQVMFDLRRQGYELTFLRGVANSTKASANVIRKDVELLIKEKSSFVKEARAKAGAELIEKEISDVQARKQRFLAAFDDPVRLAERKLIHRSEWMSSRQES